MEDDEFASTTLGAPSFGEDHGTSTDTASASSPPEDMFAATTLGAPTFTADEARSAGLADDQYAATTRDRPRRPAARPSTTPATPGSDLWLYIGVGVVVVLIVVVLVGLVLTLAAA